MTKYLRILGCVLSLGLAAAISAQADTLEPSDAGGGALSPPAAYGDYLYVGTGATLSIWNMADPAAPAYIGRSAPSSAPAPIRALAVVGDSLYAAWNAPDGTGGLIVYSLADPAHPAAVAEIDDYVASDYKHPAGLAAVGNYVYVGDTENGLFVLDATDPVAPVVVGSLEGVHEFSAMAAFGDQLVASGTSFLGDRIVSVVDIADPTAPAFAGSAPMSGDSVLRAVLTDGYAIGVGNDLVVYDLHDPSNIEAVYTIAIDQATHAVRRGDVLYLLGATGLQVWNFATPSAPMLLRTVPMDAFAPDQAADTPFGPVVLTHLDHGLVIGTDDPLFPTLESQFALPVGVSAHMAAFDADHVYFAEEGYGIGVADPATLAPLGRYDADLPFWLGARDMEDIAVDAGRAYLAAWGYGVLIADLSNPAAPVELGRFEFPYATAIAAKGDRAYVSSTTNGGIFKVLDVSDPAAPAELGSLLTSKTMDLAVAGDYAFLADNADFGDGGLRVVDVSDPNAPTVVGQELGCPWADGIDVSADGNTVYIACASDENYQGTLRIVDTSDKANPALIGSIVLPGTASLPDYNAAHGVRVAGTVAYVGNEYGLDEIDISDPAAPVQTARHATGYTVRAVAIAPDGRVFAFSGESGTFVYTPAGADVVFANGFD